MKRLVTKPIIEHSTEHVQDTLGPPRDGGLDDATGEESCHDEESQIDLR